MRTTSPATIYLVGAGPGDPDLLTVKAQRLISEADVVAYDRLVGEEILDLIPKTCHRIFVGKEPKCHHMAQDDINRLLVSYARAGQGLVRLKGGDPFIFGRGGEEAEALRAQGIPVEIVPGISAAAGCAASIGIPLTHRDCATGVRFVTGHRRNGLPLDLNWQSLADPNTTLVVYMGLKNFPEIADHLMVAGLPPTTPVAAISNGSTRHQEIHAGSLCELPARLPTLELRSPVLFIIGKVVTLSDRLWIDQARSTAESLVHG